MFFQVESPCREKTGGKIRNGTQTDSKHLLIYAHLRKTFPTLNSFCHSRLIGYKQVSSFWSFYFLF